MIFGGTNGMSEIMGNIEEGKMSNEEYREGIRKILEKVDNSNILRYFYVLLPGLIKEWQ